MVLLLLFILEKSLAEIADPNEKKRKSYSQCIQTKNTIEE